MSSTWPRPRFLAPLVRIALPLPIRHSFLFVQYRGGRVVSTEIKPHFLAWPMRGESFLARVVDVPLEHAVWHVDDGSFRELIGIRPTGLRSFFTPWGVRLQFEKGN